MKMNKVPSSRPSSIGKLLNTEQLNSLLARIVLLIMGLAVSVASLAAPPDGFIQTQIQRPDGNQWSEAVAMAFDPIGRLWVTEMGGRIWIVDSEDPHGTAPVPFLDISDEVGRWRDQGMLGMVLDPQFNETGYVYVYYIVDRHHLLHCTELADGVGLPVCDSAYDSNTDEYHDASIGRITRYQAIKPNGEDDYHHAVAVNYDSRKVLVGESFDSGFPITYHSHSVGTLLFGEDGTLLASFGDGSVHGFPDRGSAPRTYYEQALADSIIRQNENVGAYRSQMADSLNGKVIRIDPFTGDGLTSNPFFDQNAPRSARSRVWVMGLRNPFRMTLRPQTGEHFPSDANPGTLYIGDVGDKNFEELNIADRAGLNFGWPLYEGMADHYTQDGSEAFPDLDVSNLDAPNPLFGVNGCTQEFFNFSDLIRQDTLSTSPLMNPCTGVDPIPLTVPTFNHRRPAISWFQNGFDARWSTYNGTVAEHPLIGQPNSAGTKTVTGAQFQGATAIGGTWYMASVFPEEYHNTYFMADYAHQWIRNFVLDDNNEAVAVREFDNDAGGVVAMAVNPLDGALYYISWATFVNKVEYAPDGNQPPTAIATSNTNFGATPLTVQFNGDLSFDPEDQPLAFLWDFDDGTPTSDEANPQHTFTTPDVSIANFTVTLSVIDSGGETDQDTVLASVNNTPPTLSSVMPADGTLYPLTTDTIFTLSADFLDAESPNDMLVCEWQTFLHHDTHTHNDPIDTNCDTSTLISPLGCGFETFYYVVHLKISDPHGLSVSHRSQLNPNCTGDQLLPTISLNGANPQIVIVGESYNELGATAQDHAGGDITESIIIDSSSVNTNATGNYVVTYDVTDSWGISATTVNRSISVLLRPIEVTSISGGGAIGLAVVVCLVVVGLRRKVHEFRAAGKS